MPKYQIDKQSNNANIDESPNQENASNKDHKINNEQTQKLHPKIDFILMIEQDLQYTFSELLERCADICSPLKNSNDPTFTEKFSQLSKHFKFRQKLLEDATKMFREDYQKLLDVNKLLIQRIKENSDQQTKNLNSINAQTQTDIPPQKIDIALNTDSNDIDSPIKPTKHSNLPNYSKILIQKVPNSIDTSQLSIEIQKLTQIPVSSIKFVNKIKLKHENSFNVNFNLPSNASNRLIQNKIIQINQFTLNVVPFISVVRCHKCQNFGHHFNMCTNKIACKTCSKPHNIKLCKEPPKCTNCTFNNLKYNTDFNTDHPTTSKDCKSLKKHINSRRKILLDKINKL